MDEFVQQTLSANTQGATHLARSLPNCTCLENLEMPWNDVGPDGAEYLARALPSCDRLMSMNLCECNLQAQGATHLAASLHKCPLLTAVNLSDNAIGDDGMTELAKVLPVNTSLTSLNLSRCVFMRTAKSSVTGVLLPVSVCAHAFDHLMQYEHSDVLDAFVRSQQERDWCAGG